MINSYAYAKANNINFWIEHKVPFSLEEFLQPNKYNWILEPSEKSYNLKYASPLSMLDNPYEDGKRLLSLSKRGRHTQLVNYIMNYLPQPKNFKNKSTSIKRFLGRTISPYLLDLCNY